jgi:predicted dehydrogenase
MRDDAPLRVALVGYGPAGEVFHAPLVAGTTTMELAGVVTRDAGRRARAASRFPRARLMTTPDEIWADASQFDLVVVASPNRTHVAIALEAVQAGLAVVVDKPLAGSVADAVVLREAAAPGAVPITVFQNRRFDGDFLTVRRLLADGALGPVHRFESRFERWRPVVDARAWRESGDPADAGGLLYDLGSHLVDQALVLFGPVESVYAELRCVRPTAQVADDVFVALTHRCGVISHLWTSMLAAEPGPRMRVSGSAASFVKFGLDVQEDSLRRDSPVDAPDWGVEPEESWGRITSDTGSRPVPTVAGCYPRFYDMVAEAIRGRGPMPVGIDDAIATLGVIEAAQASAEEHSVVHL